MTSLRNGKDNSCPRASAPRFAPRMSARAAMMVGKLAPMLFLVLSLIGASLETAMAASTKATSEQTPEQTVNALSNHFTAVPTMTGEFIQFNPDGQQTGGIFYLERPGRIRFNYEKPNPVEVISNGKTVAVHNRKLKTWDFYPLDKTPLKLLLADKIEFSPKTVRSVVNDTDMTTIVMGDEKIFGDSEITLMFDPSDFDLRQWTIKDAKGAETSVMVFNVQKNVEIPEKLFKFDERAIQMRRQQRGNNQ
ncbi:MAG: outer membrane lipoprotein carrier protein LolA [Nitratireductor sp.]